MFRNAACGLVLAMAVFGGACVPGAIGPRRGGGMDDAGNTAGGEIVAARDAKFGLFMHWGVYSIPGRGEWR